MKVNWTRSPGLLLLGAWLILMNLATLVPLIASLGILLNAVGVAAGYNAGVSTIGGLRLSALSTCGFADVGVVGPLALGASVGAFHLSVNAPSELTPGSESTWSPQLTLRARLRLRGAQLAASLGPELHSMPRTASVSS